MLFRSPTETRAAVLWKTRELYRESMAVDRLLADVGEGARGRYK